MNLIVNKKILILTSLLGVVFIISGFVLGYRVFPNLVEKKVWENVILTENTEQWTNFMKIPFPFQIKVCFFNVSNPDQILQGAKPIVKEVGPYVYDLYRWRNDIEWNDDEISFYEYTSLEFNRKASGKLSDNDLVTILNLPLNALIMTVEQMFPDALETVDSVISIMFGEYDGLFITASVRQLLFSGQIICKDGGDADFAAKIICTQFKNKAKLSRPMQIVDQHIDYAYLRYKNHTHLGRFTINTGQKVRENVWNLVKYENKEYISVWNGQKSICNKIHGSIMFPPFLTKNMTFDLFAEDICRHMPLKYNDTDTVKGIQGYRFTVPKNAFNRPTKDSPDYCYCTNRSPDLNGRRSGCLGDGILDMTTCVGAPIILSFPHLLYADPNYRSSVEGLKPSEQLHSTFATVEPISGAPLQMAKRVQFNMFVRPVLDITFLENVSNSLMPVFWIEESVTLSDDKIDLLKNLLLKNLKKLTIVQWVIIGLGMAAVFVSVALILHQL